jgi:flagellar protein FliS
VSRLKAADVYRQNAILTASPEKLVVLLYEGAIRHMEKCRQGLTDPATCRDAATGESLGKAYSIVGELRTALDHEAGGEIAQDLDRLYDFTLEQLHQANVTRKPEPVEHGLRVMRTLKEGWDGIVPR